MGALHFHRNIAGCSSIFWSTGAGMLITGLIKYWHWKPGQGLKELLLNTVDPGIDID